MKYNCIKQHDITDCGAACLVTICRQYGYKKPISQIREIAGTDKQGTNALGLVKAAENLGFIAKGVKGNQESLSGDFPLPAIAHVIKDNLLHYVVIHRIKNGQILVADPGEGLVTYTIEDFCKIWSGVLILMIPDKSFEKKDETKGMFSRFLSLIFPHKKIVFEIFVSSILLTLLGILGAFYFKYLIDEVFSSGLRKSLHVVSIGMVILSIFKVLLSSFRQHLLQHMSQKIDVALIFEYYRHVLKLPMSFFDTRKVGEILSRLNDASKIRSAISGATLTVMIDTLMVLGGGAVLYSQSHQLFFVALIFIPFSIIVVWAFTKPFQKGHSTIMSQAADTESYLVESLGGISTIKAVNGEDQTVWETEKRFIKTIKSGFRIGVLQNIQGSLQGFLSLIGGIVILWVGGVQVLNGNLSIGQLITFNSLLVYFYDPIKNLIGLQPALQEAFIAADRLGEILDLEIESPGDEKLLTPEKVYGNISINSVKFRYGTRKYVLEDINLSISAGEKIAFVGESGSGKTTLIKLLLKYYLPEEGEILFDGNNVKDLQTSNLRSKVGYVPQDILLFSGTIMENISFGQHEATFEEVVEASKKAKAHDFINDMTNRYNTVVGERGATLSGGQRQRIALARAILGNPDILIFDEATSNLDSIAERAIHETIENLSKNVTTIIIAHRLSTIMRCDRIVVMDNGKIVEIGSHHQLLSKDGYYSKLWEGQVSVEYA